MPTVKIQYLGRYISSAITQTSNSEHHTRNTLDWEIEKQSNNSVLLICFYVFNIIFLFYFIFFLLVMVKVGAFFFPCPSFKSGLEKGRTGIWFAC